MTSRHRGRGEGMNIFCDLFGVHDYIILDSCDSIFALRDRLKPIIGHELGLFVFANLGVSSGPYYKKQCRRCGSVRDEIRSVMVYVAGKFGKELPEDP